MNTDLIREFDLDAADAELEYLDDTLPYPLREQHEPEVEPEIAQLEQHWQREDQRDAKRIKRKHIRALMR